MKIFLPAIMMLALLCASSCKKNYTCLCTYYNQAQAISVGLAPTYSTTISAANSTDAKSECSAMATNDTYCDLQ